MSRSHESILSDATILVAIDDTDTVDSEYGTGKVSRLLGDHLEQAFPWLSWQGSVRQQLLIDPRVPYTTHNSAACLLCVADGDARLDEIRATAAAFLEEIAADGSDPGLCIGRVATVAEPVVEFGIEAGDVVVDESRAYAVADESDLFLAAYGGTGEGVIGALAAVGRTATGNYGRFIEYGQIRAVSDDVSVSKLRADGIHIVSEAGEPIDHGTVEADGWVRPLLRDGVPVVEVTAEASDRYRPTNLES